MLLDRKHSNQATTPIYVDLSQQCAPIGRAISGEFWRSGKYYHWFSHFAPYLFGANLGVHDLLLIDDRGRGSSGTIQCDELQYETALFETLANCAAQLGTKAKVLMPYEATAHRLVTKVRHSRKGRSGKSFHASQRVRPTPPIGAARGSSRLPAFTTFLTRIE